LDRWYVEYRLVEINIWERGNVMKMKDIKQEEAVFRQEDRDKRCNQEQLDVLDKRLGRDIGAKKERARLKKEN